MAGGGNCHPRRRLAELGRGRRRAPAERARVSGMQRRGAGGGRDVCVSVRSAARDGAAARADRARPVDSPDDRGGTCAPDRGAERAAPAGAAGARTGSWRRSRAPPRDGDRGVLRRVEPGGARRQPTSDCVTQVGSDARARGCSGSRTSRDVRQGVRRLVREPGFSLPAVATVALGIGVMTAVFAGERGADPAAAVPDSGRLVQVGHAASGVELAMTGILPRHARALPRSQPRLRRHCAYVEHLRSATGSTGRSGGAVLTGAPPTPGRGAAARASPPPDRDQRALRRADQPRPRGPQARTQA